MISLSITKPISSNFFAETIKGLSSMMSMIGEGEYMTSIEVLVKQASISNNRLDLAFDIQFGQETGSVVHKQTYDNGSRSSEDLMQAIFSVFCSKLGLQATSVIKPNVDAPELDLVVSGLFFSFIQNQVDAIEHKGESITWNQFEVLSTPKMTAEDIKRSRLVHTTMRRRKALKLKRAVFVGDSLWEFIGERSMYVSVRDQTFLDRVRNGEVKMHAGMIMRCDLSTTYTYNKEDQKRPISTRHEAWSVSIVPIYEACNLDIGYGQSDNGSRPSGSRDWNRDNTGQQSPAYARNQTQ